MRSKPVARRLHGHECEGPTVESSETEEHARNGRTQEAAGQPESARGSGGEEGGSSLGGLRSSDESDCGSDAVLAPTLVPHIKQEQDNMPPGAPDGDFYSALDYGIKDAETYLSRAFSPEDKLFKNLPDYQSYLTYGFGNRSPVKNFEDNGSDKYPERSSLAEGGEERLPPELVCRDGGVWARVGVAAGTRFGPFLGKWEVQPLDRRFAWEVVASNGLHGWLDATTERRNWLKYIRSTNQIEDVNVEQSVSAGQMWYRLSREVRAGQELLIGPKTPLSLLDVLGGAETPLGSSRAREAREEESEEEEEPDPRCNICESTFPDIDSLDLHQVSAHRQPAGSCPCERCPRAYSSRELLLRHRAIAHSDHRKFSCENCPKRHIRARHVGARSHACPECGKTFATNSGLKQHKNIHSSIKPFQCEVCFKAYTQFSNLCRHKRLHSPCRSQVKCGKCSKIFNTVMSLTKHKRSCNFAGTPPAVNIPPQLQPPLPNIPGMANPNNMHPYSMYGPNFPFRLPYTDIFQLAAPSAYLPRLLFNHEPTRMLEQNTMPKPDLIESITGLERSASPSEAKRFKSLHGFPTKMPTDKTEANHAPLRPQGFMSKISPPTAEEASSHLRPSPARPQPTPLSLLSLPREENRSSPNEFANKNDKDVEKLDSPSLSRLKEAPTPKTIEVNTSDDSDNEEEPKKEGEQPLDLSVSRKRRHSTSVEANVDDHSFREMSLKSYSPSETPDRAGTPTDNASDAEVDVESEEPLVSTSHPATPRTSPPIAYPRPIHHSLVEFMFNSQNFSFRPTGSANSMLAPHTPYPPVPFLPASILDAARVDNNYPKFRDMRASGGKMRDRYACKFCGKVFPRSANLTRHLRTHTGEQPYKCKYCERSFSISSNLQRHVRNIHNKERPFRCPLCERCFGQQTNLDRHLKKHEAEGADSPSSADTEREDTYFDEIRSFMGKVGCSPPARSPSAPRSPHPSHPAMRPSALTVST